MKATTRIISRKKSGNLTINSFTREEWEVLAECATPKELKEAVNAQGFVTVIKSEYSQSNLKCLAKMYTEKDALKAFGLDSKKQQ